MPVIRIHVCLGLLFCASIAAGANGCDSSGTRVVADDSGVDSSAPGPDAAVDQGSPAESGTLHTAQQWFSSDTNPFQLNNTDLIWFKGPRPTKYMLSRQKDLPITAPGGTHATAIAVDPSVTYQTILGTGDSMEEGSVWNILQLSPAKQTELLTALVDPVNGMGVNLWRIMLGNCDCTSRAWYTYDDMPAGQQDPTLARFSIQKDIDYGIIGILKRMLAINPKIRFFASACSPPGWMKDSGQILGGSLLDADIPVLAKYDRMFVEAYRAQGIPVYAMTLQNEPYNDTGSLPSCHVSPSQEAVLVKAFKQELAAGNLDTRAWVFDQNFPDGVAYAQTIFSDPAAYAATDGVAFHDYAGDPSAMSTLHDLYPDMDIFFTEKTLWGCYGVDRAAQYFRNWARSYAGWITMLDQNGAPYPSLEQQKPRKVMRSITYKGDEYYWTPEHYLFGLYSKFLQDGAKRISSDYGSAGTVTNVAFLNPDGTVLTVVANQTTTTQQFVLLSEGNQIWAALEGKTAASYVWMSGQGKSALPPVDPTH